MHNHAHDIRFNNKVQRRWKFEKNNGRDKERESIQIKNALIFICIFLGCDHLKSYLKKILVVEAGECLRHWTYWQVMRLNPIIIKQ